MSDISPVSSFVNLFKSIPDTRQPWKIRHLLHEIIFICIAGTLCGCDDFESIEFFATQKREWLSKYLALPNGIPSHDTMERAFQVLDTSSFLLAFVEFTKMAAAQMGQGVIAIDGKTMRGTGDKLLRPAHIVSAWFSETGMVLGQLKTEEKSNEITLIPKLLEMISVKGHVVTIDAMGTQEAIATKIVEKSGDYVLALKANHPTLFDEVKSYFSSDVLAEIRKNAELGQNVGETGYCRHIQKGHGRAERREYYITSDIKWMKEALAKWPKLQSIGMVRYLRDEKGDATTDVRYFITSIDASAEKFAYCVRNHWGIESMHWVLDTVFNEDKRRARKVDAAENLAMTTKFVFNLLTKDPIWNGKKQTKKRLRMLCIMNEAELDRRIGSVFS